MENLERSASATTTHAESLLVQDPQKEDVKDNINMEDIREPTSSTTSHAENLPVENHATEKEDKWPALTRTHTFYIVKYPPYEDPELKLKIGQAEKDLQKHNQIPFQIINRLKETKKQQLKESDSEIAVLQEELEAATINVEKAYEILQHLRKQHDEGNRPYLQFLRVSNTAKEIASKRDVAALRNYSLKEVEKFMSLWNTSKSFRKEYEKRLLSSLSYRQLSKDGRMRSLDEMSMVLDIKRNMEEVNNRENTKREALSEYVSSHNPHQQGALAGNLIRFTDVLRNKKFKSSLSNNLIEKDSGKQADATINNRSAGNVETEALLWEKDIKGKEIYQANFGKESSKEQSQKAQIKASTIISDVEASIDKENKKKRSLLANVSYEDPNQEVTYKSLSKSSNAMNNKKSIPSASTNPIKKNINNRFTAFVDLEASLLKEKEAENKAKRKQKVREKKERKNADVIQSLGDEAETSTVVATRDVTLTDELNVLDNLVKARVIQSSVKKAEPNSDMETKNVILMAEFSVIEKLAKAKENEAKKKLKHRKKDSALQEKFRTPISRSTVKEKESSSTWAWSGFAAILLLIFIVVLHYTVC